MWVREMMLSQEELHGMRQDVGENKACDHIIKGNTESVQQDSLS